jgi:hypothetical protein
MYTCYAKSEVWFETETFDTILLVQSGTRYAFKLDDTVCVKKQISIPLLGWGNTGGHFTLGEIAGKCVIFLSVQSMQEVPRSNPTIDKNLHSFFDCLYFNGLLFGALVLTQYLNGKYCVSYHPSDEYTIVGILRHIPHASNVAVVSLLRKKRR